LVQGGLNGRPVLRFDAVDDIMTLTWGAYVVGNTWFLVLKNREVTNPSLAQTVFSSDNGDGGRGLFLFFAEGTSSLSGERITYIRVNSQIYGYGQCSSDIPAGNYIFSAKMDSSYAFTAFQNGGGLSLTQTDYGGFSSSRYPSGIDVIGKSGYGPGLDIAAIIVYNRALAEHERCQVEHYLSQRYGIAVSSSIPQPLALFLDAGMGTTLATGGVDSPVASPLEIGDCALWLDAGQGITQAGGYVSQWDDMSGNSRHASQATGASQPAYVSDGLNGTPVLRFDGTNDYLDLSSTSGNLFRNLTGASIFMVFTPTRSTYEGLFVASAGNTTAKRRFSVWHGGSQSGKPEFRAVRLDADTESYLVTETVNSTSRVYSAVTSWYDKNGAQYLSGAISGSAVGTMYATAGNTEDTDSTYVKIGVALDNSLPFAGDIAEIIVFSKALTDTERRRVERYLSIKYNIPVACGTVSQWSDQSGNARHASQSTAGYRPLLVQGGLNGRPVLRFDGTDDWLQADNTGLLQNVSGSSVFAVYNVRTPTGNQLCVSIYKMGSPAWLTCLSAYSYYGNYSFRYHDGTSPYNCNSSAATSTTHYIVSGVANYLAATAYLYKNGALLASSNTYGAGANTPDLSPSLFVGAIDSGAYRLNGDIAAIIVFNRTLSDAERQRVERWLATRYGITLA